MKHPFERNHFLAARVRGAESLPVANRALLAASLEAYPLPVRSGAETLWLRGGSVEAARVIDRLLASGEAPRLVWIPPDTAPVEVVPNNTRAPEAPPLEAQTASVPPTVRPIATTAADDIAARCETAGLSTDETAAVLAFAAQLAALPAKALKEQCALHTLLVSGPKSQLIDRLVQMRITNLLTHFGTQASSSPHRSAPRPEPSNPPPPSGSTQAAETASRKVHLRHYVARTALASGPVLPQAASAAPFRIVVDHRERTSREHASFAQLIRASGRVDCIDAQLPCGDFMFECSQTGTLFPAVVERKTLSDLAGSLVTPRYTQQKRLLRATGLRHVFLLLEGSLRPDGPDARALQRDELKRIHSGTLTTAVVDGITVLHAPTRAATVEILLAIGSFLAARAVNDEPSLQHKRCTLADFSLRAQAIKGIMEVKSVFPAVLANIHGCAADAATGIAEHFGSLSNLHDAVTQAANNPQAELQFLNTLQRFKKRQRDAAELSLNILQFIGLDEYP